MNTLHFRLTDQYFSMIITSWVGWSPKRRHRTLQSRCHFTRVWQSRKSEHEKTQEVAIYINSYCLCITVTTLWFKNGPCYIFKQLHRISASINNFWSENRQRLFSLQVHNWQVLIKLGTSLIHFHGKHPQQTTIKWVCAKRIVF